MAENEAAVIDMTDGLVSFVKQNLDALGDYKPENFTIFRVPPHIRECNKHLYEPQVVSIGPYHHGNPAFKTMQKYKWKYLHDLLARDRDNCIQRCINMLRALEPQARQCYCEPVELDADEFVKMLLLDGCFIIELLMKFLVDEKIDQVWNIGWSWSVIRSDLVLLDNQIPFFVVKSLFNLLVGQYKIDLLIELLVEWIKYDLGEGLPAEVGEEIHHLLHVYYLCFVGTPHPKSFTDENSSIAEWLKSRIDLLLSGFRRLCSPVGNSSIAKWLKTRTDIDLPCSCFRRLCSTAGNSSIAKWLKSRTDIDLLLSCFHRPKKDEERMTIPCATELEEAGVTFKKKDKKNKQGEDSSSFLFHITFQNNILEIPFLSVGDSTKNLFMNLIAFEEYTITGERKYMTSYARFMDCIVNTAKDVAILHESGIIDNMLSSDEELTSFFNELCKYVTISDDHYLAPLFKKLRKHCNSKSNKWRAKLKKDYFSNPWAVFSFVAAMALLIFAFLQTFFTIFPYFYHHT